MENQKTRIVVAVLDTKYLTLYKEDGEVLTIPQGDRRVQRIIDEVTPLLITQGYADVDLVTGAGQDNPYTHFEKQSDGMVKLYRVSKDKLKTLYVNQSKEGQEVVIVGDVPKESRKEANEVSKAMNVMAEIMAHATPVSSEEFSEDGLYQQGNVVEESGVTLGNHSEASTKDTVIAVVDDKIIPGVEKIKTQFAHAASNKNTVGIQNFLKRLGAVIAKRSHSVEDLLKFMERGDLPIADDGSILIYKVLNRSGTKYVDCHSGKVEQWVGAYVCMDESLVDPNRRNECSNGLHVARRGYLRSFSGNVCVIAKLAPEDVIAVPQYDANKMRVCGYHIVHELSPTMYSLLNSNQPLTADPEGAALLGRLLAGDHTHRTHEVRINAQMGGNVQVKALDKPKAEKVTVVVEEVHALDNPDKVIKVPEVAPKEVVAKVANLSRKEQAQVLFNNWVNAFGTDDQEAALEELRAFKKAAKVGWAVLDIPDPVKYKIKKLSTTKTETKKTIAPVKPTKPKAPAVEENLGSASERIKRLLAIGIDERTAQAILNIKRAAKKSWENLGVKPAQVKKIEKLTS